MAEIAMPIVVAVVVAWDYFSFSSHINGDGYDYAETYLRRSKMVRVTIPERCEERAVYYQVDWALRFATRREYRQLVFYAPKYRKYMAVVSFSGVDEVKNFDFDFSRKPFDREFSRKGIYRAQPTILAYANTTQWNDVRYGTKECPMPIFVFRIIRLHNNQEPIGAWNCAYGEDKVAYDVTSQYVGQYLSHFMPEAEFERLFKKR